MRADNIRIDRGAAARAIRSLIAGAKKAVGRGQSVLIFPEGTRMAPGEAPDYKPGVAALYAALDLPAVPIALNSGVFWRRREFVKRPGRIVVEFLEPIPARPRPEDLHAPSRAVDRDRDGRAGRRSPGP